MLAVNKPVFCGLIIVCSGVISGCDWDLGSEYSPTSRTMYVDYYKQPCNDDDQQLCFRGRFDSNESFQVIDQPFSGFSGFEWGKQYTLEVEASRDDNGKDSAYSLLSVVASSEVTANTFSLTLKNTGDILASTDNVTWTLAAEKSFSCSDAQCEGLVTSEQNSSTIELSFTAAGNALTLNSVLCQSADDSFSADCGGEAAYAWDIAHYLSECGATLPGLCLLYKEKDAADTEYQVLPVAITDFTHQWGVRYLDMDITVVDKAGVIQSVTREADASTEEQVTDAFVFVMRTGPGGLANSSAGLLTYDGQEFDCDANNQCAAINSAIDEADADSVQVLLLQAEVSNPGESAELKILDLICNANAESFESDCMSGRDDVFWSLR